MTFKILSSLLILASITSLFFPFQEFESMWAEFDFSKVSTIQDFDEDLAKNKTISGLELILPIIPVLILVVGNILLIVNKRKLVKLIGTVLIILGTFVTLRFYLLLNTPAESLPGSLSRPPVPMIGFGYYILLISALISLIFSILTLKRAYQ